MQSPTRLLVQGLKRNWISVQNFRTISKGLPNISANEDLQIVTRNQTRVNQKALHHYQKLIGFLSPNNNDIILDFGCGTGETTIKMAEGEFIHEKPRKVVGVDIDAEVIQVCQEAHGDVENASFYNLDISDPVQQQKFLDEYGGKVSLITAFFVLHFVIDHPEAVRFFNECLKDHGKLICVICQGMSDDSPYTMAWKSMLNDERFGKYMSKFQPRSCSQVYHNNDWMTSNKHIIKKGDYQKLLEDNSFITEQIKELTFSDFSLPTAALVKSVESGIPFGIYAHADELQAEFIKRYEQFVEERGINNTLEYFRVISTNI